MVQNLAPSNVLYNGHLAPGAVLSGVSMLGGDANAVAGLAAGVPVAVMTRKTLAACGVAMRDALRGEAGIEARIRDHKLRTEDEIAAARTELAAYGAWFRAQFGVPAKEARIGLSFAEVSLIGPVPADPTTSAPVYHPLTGANVLAQAQGYFKVEGLHAWPEAYRAEVTRMGALLAGGDPHEIVRPVYLAKAF